MIRSTLVLALLFVAAPASAQTLMVGPGMTYTTIAAAAAASTDGATIEIAAGTYHEEVVWTRNGLTIHGNGAVIIDMTGMPLQNQGGKGIFIVNGRDTIIDNVTFVGATCSSGNGAGIRWQAEGMLTVRNCTFRDNEDGILGGDFGDNVALIENNEFSGSGRGMVGYTHNIYINEIDTLTFRGNYSHSLAPETSDIGHLFKSRAHHNLVLYNRLTAEDSHSSYELQLPEGGIAYVIGNLIEQGNMGPNRTIVSIGGDGMQWPDHHVFLINNTIVNDDTSGTFIQVMGPVDLDIINNLIVGPGTLLSGGATINMMTNRMGSATDLVSATTFDYHLAAGSPAIDMGTMPGTDGTMSLVPVMQYVHPHATQTRGFVGTIDIGAYEYGNTGVTPDAGPIAGDDAGPGVDAGHVIASVDAGPSPSDAGHSAPSTGGGCCGVAGTRSPNGALFVLAMLALVMCRRAR